MTAEQQKSQSKLLDDMGAFFAFNNEQLKSGIKEGVKYVSCGMGLFCPKANVDSLLSGIKLISKNTVKARLKTEKIDSIIESELANYECYYSRDISDAVESCKAYGVKAKDVRRVFLATDHKYD